MAKRKGIPHFFDGTIDGLLGVMDNSGIDLSLISRITTKKENVKVVNEWLRNCNRPQHPDPWPRSIPDLPVASSDLESLRAQGFKGVKLHPDYQGFFVDDPRMYPFYEAAQATQMPQFCSTPAWTRGLPPTRAMPCPVAC